MIDGFIRNIREQIIPRESGEKLSLLATGGLSESIITLTQRTNSHITRTSLLRARHIFLKRMLH